MNLAIEFRIFKGLSIRYIEQKDGHTDCSPISTFYKTGALAHIRR